MGGGGICRRHASVLTFAQLCARALFLARVHAAGGAPRAVAGRANMPADGCAPPLALHAFQVAGHADSVFTDGAGLLYKRFQSRGRGLREEAFYAHFRGSDFAGGERALLPRCHGVVGPAAQGKDGGAGAAEDGAQGDDGAFLVLEDLTAGYVAPCVIDAKLGRRSWYESARPDWRQKCANKDAKHQSHVVGFRLCGAMRTRRRRKGDAAGTGSVVVERLGKEWGQKAGGGGINGVVAALAAFMRCDDSGRLVLPELMASGLTEALDRLEAWTIHEGSSCRINSASALILYEGDAKAAAATGRRPQLKVVDFAHSFIGAPECDDGLPHDENFRAGVRGLRAALEKAASSDRRTKRLAQRRCLPLVLGSLAASTCVALARMGARPR